jgi:hypothetical protein
MKKIDSQPDGDWMPTNAVQRPFTTHRSLNQKLWVRAKTAADVVDVSRDTVERRGIPWQDHPVPHRLRYKLLRLSEETEPERRYYLPDLRNFLENPPARAQPLRMVPQFKEPSQGRDRSG